MPIENPKYDVALSFLSKDESIASAVHQKLAEGLEVFFFPRKQDALAGTDGLESMRRPFFDDSRLMVILYRKPWGKTPWTRVEETAIKEACLEHGWQRLFFIVLDSASVLPLWLPQNYVRFNYVDYGLEQAVGAIKARVQENGGQVAPMNAVRRAQILEAEQQFLRDKARMNSDVGLDKIQDSVQDLFTEIQEQCKQIEGSAIGLRCGASFAKGNALQSCAITNGRVGLNISWRQRFANSLDQSGLSIRELNGGIILPDQPSSLIYVNEPEKLDEKQYSPDLSLAREYGWKSESEAGFISSRALAERCVIQFLDLVSRHSRGELPERSFP